jgi:hypothetical protein
MLKIWYFQNYLKLKLISPEHSIEEVIANRMANILKNILMFTKFVSNEYLLYKYQKVIIFLERIKLELQL